MNPIANFIAILKMNMPAILRKAKFYGLIEVFGTVLNRVNAAAVYAINHSGEEASMEHYLNDRYGLTYYLPSREADIAAHLIIWIDDGSNMEDTYLYNKSEMGPPTYVYNNGEPSPGPLFVYNFSEFYGMDFKVMVPASLPHNEAQLRAHVRRYRQGGARFIKILY